MNVVQKKKVEEAIPPSAVWVALTAVPRPTRTIPIPRLDPETGESVGEIVMWPLKQEELMAANAEADRWAKQILRDPQKREEANLGYQSIFSNEVSIQILFRACRDATGAPDFKRPAFPSPAHIRAEFTTDETGVLFNNYCTVQSELGPIIAYLEDGEYEALVLRLVEGGSAFPFDSLSWEAQRALVRFLVSRLTSCWTAMFSAGLPLDVVSPLVVEWCARQAEKAQGEAGPFEPSAEPSPTEG